MNVDPKLAHVIQGHVAKSCMHGVYNPLDLSQMEGGACIISSEITRTSGSIEEIPNFGL